MEIRVVRADVSSESVTLLLTKLKVHFCSKYGHLDLCRWLIGQGCSPVTRNSSGQTPYDVAENHLVRQFLLPLQFQAERDSNGKEYIGAGGSAAQGPAIPVENGPLYEAANSLMAPRPAYPGYVTVPSGTGYPPAVSPHMPPFQAVPPAPMAGSLASQSNDNMPSQHVPPFPSAAPGTMAVVPGGVPRPPIVGAVVVNKVQAHRIPTNTVSAPVEEPASPCVGNVSPSAYSAPPPQVPFMSPQHVAPVAAPPVAPPPAAHWAPPVNSYKPPTTTKRVITAGLPKHMFTYTSLC